MIPGFFSAGAVRGGGPAPGGDPYWENVVSLLHFEGADDSNTFHDEKGHTWAAYNGASITHDFAVFGQSSGRFVKTSGHQYIHREGSDLLLGVEDFTIEFFVRVDDASKDHAFVDMRPGQGTYRAILIESDAGNIYCLINGVYVVPATPSVILSGVAHHVALTRAGEVFRIFVDGTLVGQGASTVDLNTTSLAIGANMNTAPSNSTFDLNGNVDEFRLTKGVARYTSNFTPPDEPFPDH